MVTMTGDVLEFNFPEVHPKAKCSIEFQRTLRIPDDNRAYSLPPGLGSFPLLHVEDFKKTTPDLWQERGGVFLPMYQSEALWINFRSDWFFDNYPFAVKIAAGKVNAITGEHWSNALSAEPQDYVILPEQPWLDGFCVAEGLIRQFVAMPLGEGFTAEEQLTGKADFGGLQICVCPMKREKYEELQALRKKNERKDEVLYSICRIKVEEPSMGFAPGGLMRQKIHEDKHGIDVWDCEAMSRCFIHVANSEQYLGITGQAPPTKPPTAKQYTNAGLPWFEYYSTDKTALKGAKKLANLDSVAAKMIKLGKGIFKDNEPVNPTRIVSLGQRGEVKDGRW